jgi:hypothetical protein
LLPWLRMLRILLYALTTGEEKAVQTGESSTVPFGDAHDIARSPPHLDKDIMIRHYRHTRHGRTRSESIDRCGGRSFADVPATDMSNCGRKG